ncbi:MAG TPA: hypothetical protein VGA84_00805 [Thermoanaerobaculia bacterium]
MRGEAVFVGRKSAAVFLLALAVVARSRGSEVSRQGTETQAQPRETAQPRDSATAPITINDDQPVYTEGGPFMLTGTSLPGAVITIAIEKSGNGQTTADDTGHWTLMWTAPMKTGTWTITATSGGVTATQLLRVQIQGNLQRQPMIVEPIVRYGTPEIPHPEAYQEMTDRWRITPPPYELTEKSKGRPIGENGATLDPYNQNLIKGDLPFLGKDWFLNVTGISDTLAESRTLPTPSGVSAVKPTSITVFGKDNQNLFNQNLIASFDLFEGDTAFKPIMQRWKATIIGNLNYVHLRENGLVKPDVRRGTSRTDGYLSVQELFYERKIRDVSPNYDFISIRVGSQPFNSDFRGFLFNDTNLGVRVFGNFASNRYQYNFAVFDRFEKDTSSGLNTMQFRDQQVAIANFYWQDFLVHGYTQQFSVHYVRDAATFHYDRNGILVRPAPVGVFTPHEIRATYIGESGLGHIGRFNVDHAAYFVFGHDDLNPIAGPDPNLRGKDGVKIGAASAALEVSYDRDWYRPRLALFYASGDRNPRDRNARGFDAIFDSPAFAGGGFSFFNRLGIRLPTTGVALVERGSLLTSLRSSKDEGQPNYVNPGVQIVSAGLDVDVTPRLKAIFTGNYIRFDATESVEAILFQGNIHKTLGTDLSLGLRYRPLLNQNIVIVGGTAAFLPGRGFKDIYEKDRPLYHLFTNVILTF